MNQQHSFHPSLKLSRAVLLAFFILIAIFLILQNHPAGAAVPGLNLDSFLSSDLIDTINTIALGHDGAIYVAGKTSATTFPLVNPYQSAYGGGESDGFFTVFAPDGQSLLTSTYLGGNGTDEITSLEISHSGRVYLTGSTSSTNFPVSNPYQPLLGGAIDGFVTVFESDLESIYFSTYIGGSDLDRIDDLALGEDDSVHLVGNSYSNDFPLMNPYQFYQAAQDLILAGLTPDGQSLLYGTYLGGAEDEQAYEIVLDSNGRKYITGYTESPDFPTANAYQPTHNGDSWDGFVSVLSADSQSLEMSTFIGGSMPDRPYSIQLDNSERIVIAGGTQSPDFPVQNPYQPLKSTGWDGFLTIFNPDAQSLYYSTFLGGNAADSIHSISINEDGRIHATGDTYSTNFPLINPYQSNNNGAQDTFLTTFNSDGQSLYYSTYLGGNGSDIGQTIDLDEHGSTFIAGLTWSTNFPLMNPFQPTITGSFSDGFVSVISEDGQSLLYSTYLGSAYPAPTDVTLTNVTRATPENDSAVPAWLWLAAALLLFFLASILLRKFTTEGNTNEQAK